MSSRASVRSASSAGGDDGSRPHTQPAEQMPSGHDTELGMIFREMRRAMGVTRERIAGRLATSVETIDILESGNLLALPDWQEVTRIVTAYAAQLGLDSGPILRRMKGQMESLRANTVSPTPSASEASAPATGDTPAPPSIDIPAAQPRDAYGRGGKAESPSVQPHVTPPEASGVPGATDPQPAPVVTNEPVRGAGAKGRFVRFIRSVANWTMMLCFVGALAYGLWYASQNPKTVWNTIDGLPAPIPGMMRSAWDLVRPLDQLEPRPQIFDPENRKSDKLP